MKTHGKRLLCLWLPNWPIQRLKKSLETPENLPSKLGNWPETRAETLATGERATGERALILWGLDPRRGRLVVACCDSSTDLGVRPGMTLSQADALVRPEGSGGAAGNGGSDPWIGPHDSQADFEALSELAERCAGELSPLVALEPLEDFLWAGQVLHQPQALLIDVTGIGELFGGEPELVQRALNLLEEVGYQGRIAIADTVGAAWGVSRCAPVPANQSTDQPTNQPAAWIIPPGQQQRALAPLRIAALRVRPEVTVMLRRLGVERIEALARLPRIGLVTRFGPELLARLDQALGTLDETIPMHHASVDDRMVVDLEYPTADLDIVGHQLEKMVRAITGGLAARGRGALRLVCRLECKPDSPLEIRLGLFAPTAAAGHLLRLLRTDLERHRLKSETHRLVVAVTMTGKLGMRQPSLAELDDDGQASVAELAKLIDAFSGRLGRNRVLGAEPSHNPLPEQSLRLRPLTGQPTAALVPGRPASRTKQSSRTRPTQSVEHQSTPHLPTPSDPLRRPLFLHPHPPVITPVITPVSDSESELNSELVECFRIAGRVEKVMRFWGPERLETGWWHGPMHRRDYYRIETENGQWLWIYRDLRTNTWYLHGHFG